MHPKYPEFSEAVVTAKCGCVSSNMRCTLHISVIVHDESLAEWANSQTGGLLIKLLETVSLNSETGTVTQLLVGTVVRIDACV